MRLLFLTAAISVFFVFTTYHQTFAQINIPTQFSTYTNEEYNIEIEYPSEWQIFGDRVPGDYVTDIAVFVPSSEINFKEYDSYKDFKKLDMRILVFLDYSFILPKLNLNFALDNAISANSDTQSEATSGFKKFKVIESNTNSKLDDKKAYKLIFQAQRKGDTFKYFTLGTIINDNQVLGVNFKAPLEKFDLLLPTFQHMIDSFKIGEVVNDNNNFDTTDDESRSVINTNNNEDAINKIFKYDEN